MHTHYNACNGGKAAFPAALISFFQQRQNPLPAQVCFIKDYNEIYTILKLYHPDECLLL